MDDTMKVEFPLGTSGETVTLARPSEGQLFAITILRKPGDGSTPAQKHRFIERTIRFLETLAGADQWARVEDLLFADRIQPGDLLQLFGDVLEFDWSANSPAPVPDPVAEPDDVPPRPAPRVVSGG